MDFAALVVMILCVIGLAGVLVYFVLDYKKYKEEVDKMFGETEKKVTVEKVDRMANVKYVVDQVNNVNNDIYTQVTSNVNTVTDVKATQDRLLSSFGSVLSFSSNTAVPNSSPVSSQVSLLNLPGSGNIDMNLMSRVNATMGLTAKDLSGDKKVKFCSRENPSRCIQIPNSQGDLYLTSMRSSPDSAIIMDASNVNAMGTLSAPRYKIGTGLIANTGNSLTISGSNSVTIGAVASSSAALGDAIVVDPTGAINFKNAAGATVGTIRKDVDTLVLEAPKVLVRGDLQLTGNMFSYNPTTRATQQYNLPVNP